MKIKTDSDCKAMKLNIEVTENAGPLHLQVMIVSLDEENIMVTECNLDNEYQKAFIVSKSDEQEIAEMLENDLFACYLYDNMIDEIHIKQIAASISGMIL